MSAAEVTGMLEYLEKLCSFRAPSGMEGGITAYIAEQLAPYCDECFDALGNLIVFKKGASRAAKKVVLDAHTDEVGIIVTAINPDGSLRFSTVGGINTESLVSERVDIGGVYGVVQTRPVHLLSGDAKTKMPEKTALTIDIGAKNEDDARKHVRVGDMGTFDSGIIRIGDGRIMGRALDDRVGCAIMMQLIKEDLPYDAWFTFSVQEEVGCRGAKTDTYAVNPDIAIVLETTTAADIAGNSEAKWVCALGKGAAVSFMDGGTMYDKALFNAAFDIGAKKQIDVQPKNIPSGGNDAMSIHLTREGVRTIAISTPCRYLHSSSCVIDGHDAEASLSLAREMLCKAAAGEL